MEYFLLFLEGMITFISPCILPMIPVYISYFSGGSTGETEGKYSMIRNVTGFILGFSIVFTLIGALAGSFGALIKTHQGIVNFICGAIVTVFGLNYLGIFKLKFLKKSYRIHYEIKTFRFLSSILFDLNGDAANTYNIMYLPRTLFIDKNGNIVEDHVGELTETELTNAIEKLL